MFFLWLCRCILILLKIPYISEHYFSKSAIAHLTTARVKVQVFSNFCFLFLVLYYEKRWKEGIIGILGGIVEAMGKLE